MIFESLKEKFEYYRGLTDYRLLPNSYIMIMLDGRSFSKLIKNRFEKPFDYHFMNMMDETLKYLCSRISGVRFGYTQSDEILLVIKDDTVSDPFFGNRLTKLLSICASTATSKFNRLWTELVLEETGTYDYNLPLVEFDCKCWNIPSENDVVASFLYRQIDCIRNSKQQFCQTYLSHKQLAGKNTDEQVTLVKESTGNDWNEIFGGAKYGRMCFKETIGKMVQVNDKLTTVERNEWQVRVAEILTEEHNRNFLLEKL